MTENRSHKRLRTEAAERKRVLRITGKASATLGNDFFQSLVKQTAVALDADCVYIGEVHRTLNRIATLAVCLNGDWAENFEQDLPGTAAAHVVAEGNFICTENAAGGAGLAGAPHDGLAKGTGCGARHVPHQLGVGQRAQSHTDEEERERLVPRNGAVPHRLGHTPRSRWHRGGDPPYPRLEKGVREILDGS
jgi:hypothetical protein